MRASSVRMPSRKLCRSSAKWSAGSTSSDWITRSLPASKLSSSSGQVRQKSRLARILFTLKHDQYLDDPARYSRAEGLGDGGSPAGSDSDDAPRVLRLDGFSRSGPFPSHSGRTPVAQQQRAIRQGSTHPARPEGHPERQPGGSFLPQADRRHAHVPTPGGSHDGNFDLVLSSLLFGCCCVFFSITFHGSIIYSICVWLSLARRVAPSSARASN